MRNKIRYYCRSLSHEFVYIGCFTMSDSDISVNLSVNDSPFGSEEEEEELEEVLGAGPYRLRRYEPHAVVENELAAAGVAPPPAAARDRADRLNNSDW